MRDFNLGPMLPVIKNVAIQNVALKDNNTHMEVGTGTCTAMAFSKISHNSFT